MKPNAELKKAYQQASKLTKQIFYLPILRDDSWRIFHMSPVLKNFD
jgi:hypothetical protein